MTGTLHLVTFRLGAEEFGAPVGAVQEVVRPPEITPLPEAPPFVEGVINLRGRIIPVMDLGRRFRMADRPRTRAARILVAESAGRQVGLMVDAVSEVLRLPPTAVEPPPAVAGGTGGGYITGIGKHRDRLLILLDLGRILDTADPLRPEPAPPAPPERGGDPGS